jgi:hypothetical protein
MAIGDGNGIARARSGASAVRRHHEKQSFHPPAEGEVLLFMLVQKRSTQEKTTPRFRALRASMPARSACGLRGLSTAHPVLTPNWLASIQATLRAFLHPPAASEGPRVEQRASCAYFSKEPEQQPGNCRATLRSCSQLFSECGPGWPADLPGPLCGGEQGTIGRAARIGRAE